MEKGRLRREGPWDLQEACAWGVGKKGCRRYSVAELGKRLDNYSGRRRGSGECLQLAYSAPVVVFSQRIPAGVGD